MAGLWFVTKEQRLLACIFSSNVDMKSNHEIASVRQSFLLLIKTENSTLMLKTKFTKIVKPLDSYQGPYKDLSSPPLSVRCVSKLR